MNCRYCGRGIQIAVKHADFTIWRTVEGDNAICDRGSVFHEPMPAGMLGERPAIPCRNCKWCGGGLPTLDAYCTHNYGSHTHEPLPLAEVNK